MFDQLESQAQRGGVSLVELFALLGARGHYLLIFFLSLPFLQPIPLIGISTPLGVLIAWVAYLHFKGRPAWIPLRFHKVSISQRILFKMVEIAQKLWKFMDRWQSRDRGIFFLESPIFRSLNLALVVGLGVFLALPLPIPFSNTIPAFGLAIHALAQIRKDGILVLFSYAIGLILIGLSLILVLGLGWILKG